MDLKEILSYLNNGNTNIDQLKDFFEKEEIKEYLSNKWKEFENDNQSVLNREQTDIEEFLETNTEGIETELSEDTVTLTDNNIAMPLIPNIPENEETRSRQQSHPKYPDPHDQELYLKLVSKHIQLQNGKVNQPYKQFFDITDFGITNIGHYEFEGLEDIGLNYAHETGLIEGIPSKAGDHKIILKCFKHGGFDDETVFERPLTLIVNPDPRSLWNTIPTPDTIEYYKPDSDCDFVKVPVSKGFMGLGKKERKDIVAASQRGRSHAHEGNPRDDDFSIDYLTDSEWYLLTIADGAGSAQYSREGAKIACETVTKVCSSQLVKYNKEVDQLIKDFEGENTSEIKRKKLGDALYNIIGSSVFKAYKNIEKEAQDKDYQFREYSTTLLTTVAKKFKFGWFVAAFWVGDGGIGIYNKDTQYLKILGEPDGGEFAGQTRFLTMSEVMQPAEIYRRLRFEIIDDFTALILMTDGVTDPKFETDSNLMKVEKWNELWDDLTSKVNLSDDNEESKNELMEWLNFWSPGNHDDRTIAILF